ncbi:Lipocalin-like domain-containing protein [bacterium A37T11]|nr:Lipocalin-like domain-containing protein [bacterium A37T11]
MTKTKTLLTLLFIAAMMGSCSKKNENKSPDDYKTLIIGTWKITRIIQTTYIDGVKTKEDIKGPDEVGEGVITFHKDGSVDPSTDGSSTYSIEENKLTINEGGEDPVSEVFDIVSLSKTQFDIQIITEFTVDHKANKNVVQQTFTKIK